MVIGGERPSFGWYSHKMKDKTQNPSQPSDHPYFLDLFGAVGDIPISVNRLYWINISHIYIYIIFFIIFSIYLNI